MLFKKVKFVKDIKFIRIKSFRGKDTCEGSCIYFGNYYDCKRLLDGKIRDICTKFSLEPKFTYIPDQKLYK